MSVSSIFSFFLLSCRPSGRLFFVHGRIANRRRIVLRPRRPTDRPTRPKEEGEDECEETLLQKKKKEEGIVPVGERELQVRESGVMREAQKDDPHFGCALFLFNFRRRAAAFLKNFLRDLLLLVYGVSSSSLSLSVRVRARRCLGLAV